MTADVARRVARLLTPHRLIVAITLLAGLAAWVGVPATGRTLLATAFLGVCPGAAWVWSFQLVSVWDRVAVALGLSIAATAVVTQTLALAGAWNVGPAYAILAGITFAGVATSPEKLHSLTAGPDRTEQP